MTERDGRSTGQIPSSLSVIPRRALKDLVDPNAEDTGHAERHL